MLFKLVNEQQSNNCFVNVVVQNFWHLSGFVYALRDIILEADKLSRQEDGVLYELAQLLRDIKESAEGSTHSVANLKHQILTEIYGQDAFNWNEQADASEAFQMILKKYHEHF